MERVDPGYEPGLDLNMALSDDEIKAVELEVREGAGDSPSSQIDPETIDLAKIRDSAIRMIEEVKLPK